MIYFSTFCVKIELIVVLWLLEHEISIGCFNTFVPDSRTSMYYVTKNDITLYFFRYNLVSASYLAADVSLGLLA